MEFIINLIQQIDWKVILPIFTLLIGFFLGYGRDYFDRRRKVAYVKKILFTEMGDNQGVLSTLRDLRIEDKIGEFEVEIMGLRAENFSFILFETYLDRLDTLSEKEIEALTYTYSMLRKIIKNIDIYEDMIKLPENYELPEIRIPDYIFEDFTDLIETALRHNFYAMLLMQNKRVPDSAEQLNMKTIIDDVEEQMEMEFYPRM